MDKQIIEVLESLTDSLRGLKFFMRFERGKFDGACEHAPVQCRNLRIVGRQIIADEAFRYHDEIFDLIFDIVSARRLCNCRAERGLDELGFTPVKLIECQGIRFRRHVSINR